MTIIIYKLTSEKAIEIDRYSDGKFEGRFGGRSMAGEEVIKKFNRGYWRTSEI